MAGKRWLIISVFLLAMGCPSAIGQIIYVDADASGGNDGTSWANAYTYFQDALADANSAAKPVEIRVAEGIYKPDQGVGITPGDRTATFQLKNGVAIRGGYAGFGEPDPNARDVELYETILSGDLAGNDVDVNEPTDLVYEPTRAENSYHVVMGSDTDETAILDGFIISGGNANGTGPTERGGGMFNIGSRATVTNCTFSGNAAIGDGGAVYNAGSSPTVTNCTFNGNRGYYGGGMYNGASSPTLTNCTFAGNSAGGGGGGGMCNNSSSPTLTNCTFINNLALYDGGGMWDVGSNLTMTNCRFSDNSARDEGGGVFSSYSSPMLTNCVFILNSAEEGGGMYNTSHNNSTLINCTFGGNAATNGRALACNSWRQKYPSSVEASNCILWDGGDEVWNNDGSEITISYSDVQGGWAGEGNIDEDPCFANPGYWDPNGTPQDANDDFWVDGDYHLKSQAGRWLENEGRWTKDDVTSLCIDGGDMASPIGLEPFPNGGIINMGAYGGTAEASKSYFGEPVCETIVAGDINGDCKVNFKDFAVMALHWLRDENQ